ncbi:MAG: hypothetical protein HYZ84_02290 [Candidatus Omnitrophica bacterium]|nr:hypothetical protein [Candidatus Omnitrophota bacterium]
MTYQELFYLKFKKGVSTYELVKRYPDEIERVNEVALLDVPETTLREIIHEEKVLMRLMRLKRKFLG